MRSVRTHARRPIALLGVVVAVLGVVLLPGGGATAAPSPADAARQLHSLGVTMDRLNERANSARAQLRRVEAQRVGLERQRAAAQVALDESRAQVGQIAQSAYRDGGLRLSSSVLEGSPGDFFARMSTLEWLSDQQRATIAAAKQRQSQFDDATARVEGQVRSARRLRARLDRQKTELAARMRRWEKLKEQVPPPRAEPDPENDAPPPRPEDDAPHPDTRRPTDVGPASGNGARVARFALAQRGEPYVFGAAGPNAWDCSGLTQKAWAQVGVPLPHSAHQQYYQIRHVPRSDLRVGDLVFFYGLEHVGVYIGGNRVVHAPTPGESVTVTNLNYMPYAGAGRP
ncbi:C40 family peptidase [Cryptosporangium arvum]|uniref:Cell wall-associated hydrolase, invasion-associated protein n=1 Tax=Cryptosporangium arvum DSM 44712 TaxID=927661 RepID=A0A010YQG7_9ACTN|nr:C40 family peptidase [Cryptosporangium arvum]EXG82440.1 cell wall-associated hydrolase, invasion-associated protein [Cryptosporangium arvum DSM 44712]